MTEQIPAAPTQETPDKEDLFPGRPKPQPKKVVKAWRAPSRPFKKRDRQYYFTVGTIVFLISLILFFAGQFLPIAVVISVGFLAYVLSSVPPEDVNYEISTYGIEIDGVQYYWEEMGRFWFDEKYGSEMMLVEVARFPGRLILMFDPSEKDGLKALMREVLLEEKPKDTLYDRAANWIQEKIPLETSR